MKAPVSILFFVCVFSLGLTDTVFAQGRLPRFDSFFASSEIGRIEKKESEHFQVMWVHPRDGVIADALLFHLEEARKALAGDFEKAMKKEKAPVEIFPDLRSFSEVSGLSLARFRATGTIALTLEQRLMILSPRNLPMGYPWAETVVHEYIHYLIREISPDHIPIWLHEGVAQLYQGFPYTKKAELTPSQWGLFNRSRKESKLLSLETLKEPFPYRDTPEEAELAYIQALLFSEWIDKKCGIINLITLVRDAASVEKALGLCTKQTYASLENIFISEIMAGVKVPIDRQVEFFSRSFDTGDPMQVEGQKLDKEAQDFATLSNQLFDQGRYRSSGLEIKKAIEKTPAAPPSWRRHLAKSYDLTGNSVEAKSVLLDVVKDYPTDAGSWYLLALKEVKEGNLQRAWQKFLRAFYVNPFLDGLQDQMQEVRNAKPEFKDRFLLEDLRK